MPNNKFTSFYLFWVHILLILLICLLAGCAAPPHPTTATLPAPTLTAVTPTATVLPTPTPSILGSSENPITLAVVVQDGDQPVIDAAVQTAARLSTETGRSIQAQSYSNYGALIEAINQGRVHIAFLPPLTYLYARQQGLAEIAMITKQFGVYFYGTQFLSNRSSAFAVHFDPATNQVDADAAASLPQFQGKRPCLTEPGSVSGYILPAGLLAENEVPVLDPVLVQTHAGVIRALYVRGLCDFGATFAILGDPRTSASVQDLPAVTDEVQVVWRSDPVIPNLNIAFATDLSADMRDELTRAFLSIAADEDGLILLSSALDMQVQGLQAFPDSAYDPLRRAVEQSGTILVRWLGK